MDLRMWVQGEENARELSKQGIEVWTPVPEAPTRYFVSNMGRVYSRTHRHDGVIKGTVLPSGYVTVTLYLKKGDRQGATRLVSRLVLSTFEGAPPSAAHTDVGHEGEGGDKMDNRLCSLEYQTRSQNMERAWREKAAGERRTAYPKPETKKTFTLDERLVRVGLAFYGEGKVSIADLAVWWDCSETVAKRVVHGETWTHIERPQPSRRQLRRSRQEKDKILAFVAEGKTLDEINAQVSRPLTHQDLYYYRKKLNS